MQNTLYEGAVVYGKFQGIKMVIGMIFVLAIGVFISRLFFIDNRTFSKASAKVTDKSLCNNYNYDSNGKNNIMCNTSISFNTDKEYNANISAKDAFNKDENIDIVYNTNNPLDVELAKYHMSSTTKGIISVVVTFLLLLIMGVQVYFVNTNKNFAAFTGGSAAIGDTIRAFRD
jgi:hypothetical protein